MTASRFSLTFLLAAGLSLALPAPAALNAYMKIDGVTGDSRNPRHMGWIEIGSVQLDQIRNSLSAGGATSGAAASKIHFQEFSIAKKVDAATPKLFEAATKGKHFATVTIEMRKAGGGPQEYLVIKLENVLVSSYRAAGPGGAGPEESMTLNFTRATIENPPGPPRAGATAQLSAGAAPLVAQPPRITAASGRAAPYWPGPKKTTPAQPNDCAGWAPIVNVTLRSAAAAAPILR